jgi:predicted GNAT family acetyltransferase
MLHDESIPATQGIHLPTHCFPDGTVYGVVEDNMVVSVAYAHRIGDMEDEIADVGVETAPDYRRRGYARAAVSAVVDRYIQRGGEAVYGCASSNTASRATARSVGFVPYAKRMAIVAPGPE